MPQRGVAKRAAGDWEGGPSREGPSQGVTPQTLPVLTPADLVAALSQGLDLAEGRPMGHAQRVCYVAGSLAEELGLSSQLRLALYYASLFHDIAVPLASAGLSTIVGISEDALFAASPLRQPEELAAESTPAAHQAIIQAFHQHCILGARSVEPFGLADEVSAIIAAHHENWDGGGYALGMEGEEIPLGARVLAVADRVEALIAAEPSPLASRRSLASALGELSGRVLDPGLVEAARPLCRRDSFWLGLHNDHLAASLLAMKPAEAARRGKEHLLRFAEAFGAVVDARSQYTLGHSRRVAEASVALARALGLQGEHVRLVQAAAFLHDIGHLGVPPRVIAKADILNVGEMHLLRQHPVYSQRILEDLPAAGPLALWVGAHHERPDGKGYPQMTSGGEIPLEARILAVANVYAALTSDRPYRGALGRDDALQVMRGAAGTQLDAELVDLFCSMAATDLNRAVSVRR